MDVDPIDDGPAPTAIPYNTTTTTPTLALIPANISKEEEARQAIDMLRGNDVSQRVAAAHRLDSVAIALGEERTRNVSFNYLSKFFFFGFYRTVQLQY